MPSLKEGWVIWKVYLETFERRTYGIISQRFKKKLQLTTPQGNVGLKQDCFLPQKFKKSRKGDYATTLKVGVHPFRFGAPQQP
jgi:hypothetical protein